MGERPSTLLELEAERERTRRRFARRQWARRWGIWRWALALVAAVVLTAVALWLVFFSSVLAVHRVTVTGAGYLTAAQVVEAAGVPEGRPLARVDLAAAADGVRGLAAVESVEVTRAWPDRIVIAVTERRAVAVVQDRGVVRGMDSDGLLFRDYPGVPDDLPLVRAESTVGADARKEAAEVVSALPAGLVRRVDHVEVRSIDQITLRLRDGRLVRWGSAEQSALKADVIEVLLGEEARVYDVSVPGQATTSG